MHIQNAHDRANCPPVERAPGLSDGCLLLVLRRRVLGLRSVVQLQTNNFAVDR